MNRLYHVRLGPCSAPSSSCALVRRHPEGTRPLALPAGGASPPELPEAVFGRHICEEAPRGYPAPRAPRKGRVAPGPPEGLMLFLRERCSAGDLCAVFSWRGSAPHTPRRGRVAPRSP